MKRHCFLAVSWFAALISTTAPAGAAGLTHMGDPAYSFNFYTIASDGFGGVQEYEKLLEGSQIGGEFHWAVQFTPTVPGAPPQVHGEVYSNEGGQTFWSKTLSAPTGLFPAKDVVVGGMSELLIYQTFRKDEANGSLNMHITDLFLRASEMAGPKANEGLFGSVVFEMRAYDSTDQKAIDFPIIDAFGNATQLTGRGGDWLWNNTGPLLVEVTAGGESSGSISLDLVQPHVEPIDVSALEVGEFVSIEFRVVTTAWDTVQFDSVMQAFGRDPLEPMRGNFLEYSGFTPVGPMYPVPEPHAWALMLGGLGLLAWRRRRVD